MKLHILIVAENASAQMGGEAVLPLHYFRFLKARGIPAWLVTHERVRPELEKTLAEYLDQVYFVADTKAQKRLWRMGTKLPNRIAGVSFYALTQLLTGIRQRRLVRDLVAKHAIDIVHQPIPVSPKQTSFIHDVGAPVIIGPMNGGMTFPPAFTNTIPLSEQLAVNIGRKFANYMNFLFPGKRKAALLLVANERTRQALPRGVSTNVYRLVENGVDLSLWNSRATPVCPSQNPNPVFTYLGFLRDWKGVDLLLHAAARVLKQRQIQLRIVGDGPCKVDLQRLARELGIDDQVEFLGFIPQHQCPSLLGQSRALVLPSLFECGGAVVLEAMASGIPVIASKWGGPVDYLTDECGILVEPSSRERFIEDLARAMTKLADDAALARSMGAVGKQRVETLFSWDAKIDSMLNLYQAIARTPKEQSMLPSLP